VKRGCDCSPRECEYFLIREEASRERNILRLTKKLEKKNSFRRPSWRDQQHHSYASTKSRSVKHRRYSISASIEKKGARLDTGRHQGGHPGSLLRWSSKKTRPSARGRGGATLRRDFCSRGGGGRKMGRNSTTLSSDHEGEGGGSGAKRTEDCQPRREPFHPAWMCPNWPAGGGEGLCFPPGGGNLCGKKWAASTRGDEGSSTSSR